MMEEEQQLFHPDEETVVWPDKVDISQLCRICANSSEYLIPIFDGEGMENELELKIKKHLPIKISKEDPLPMSLCYQCASTLIAWHDLTLGCIEADKRLRDLADFKEERSSQSKMYEGDGLESIRGVSDIEIEFEEEVTTTPSTSAQVEFLDESDTPEKGNKRCVLKPLVKEESEQKQNQVTEDETEGNTSVIESTSDERPLEEPSAEKSTNSTATATNNIFDSIKVSKKAKKFKLCECSFCGKQFNFLKNLKIHLHSHSDKLPFSCEVCGASFKRKGHLRNHCKTKHEGNFVTPSLGYKYSCQYCGESFQNCSDLKQHKRNQKTGRNSCAEIRTNNDNGENSFNKCVKRTALRKCEECGKQFKRKDSYTSHLKTHSGERPYVCQVCGQSFIRLLGLKYHLKCVHLGIKEFNCDICGRCFAAKAAMESHRRTHTGERPYVCAVCGKSFKTRTTLNIHSKLHTDEAPYVCSYCQRRFRRKQHLINHITMHTKEKNSICDICGKQFQLKHDMIRHRTLHSGVKPFKCSVCGCMFAVKHYLTKHMRCHKGIIKVEEDNDSETEN